MTSVRLDLILAFATENVPDPARASGPFMSLLKNLAEATSEAQDTVAPPMRGPRNCMPIVLRICFSTNSYAILRGLFLA